MDRSLFILFIIAAFQFIQLFLEFHLLCSLKDLPSAASGPNSNFRDHSFWAIAKIIQRCDLKGDVLGQPSLSLDFWRQNDLILV